MDCFSNEGDQNLKDLFPLFFSKCSKWVGKESEQKQLVYVVDGDDHEEKGFCLLCTCENLAIKIWSLTPSIFSFSFSLVFCGSYTGVVVLNLN